MSIARLVLEYMDALKWPILAVVALVIFRKPISELIDRIRTMKATVGGSSVELEAARRQMEDAAEAVAEEVLAEGGGGPPAPGGLETRGGETRGGRPGATPEERAAAGAARGRALSPETYERVARTRERRRREIEALMRTAVEYGWLTGLERPNGPRPHPVIEWTEDGKPRITTFTAVDPGEAPQRAI